MPSNIGPDDDRDPNEPKFSASPLDDLFVQGATIHELSAREREAQARDREKRSKQEAKQRAKDIKHTRRTLGGDSGGGGRGNLGGGGPYDKRTAMIGFAVMIALAVVLSLTVW